MSRCFTPRAAPDRARLRSALEVDGPAADAGTDRQAPRDGVHTEHPEVEGLDRGIQRIGWAGAHGDGESDPGGGEDARPATGGDPAGPRRPGRAAQNRTAEQSPGDETGDAESTYEADKRADH